MKNLFLRKESEVYEENELRKNVCDGSSQPVIFNSGDPVRAGAAHGGL